MKFLVFIVFVVIFLTSCPENVTIERADVETGGLESDCFYFQKSDGFLTATKISLREAEKMTATIRKRGENCWVLCDNEKETVIFPTECGDK
jgi:hypothetical protein